MATLNDVIVEARNAAYAAADKYFKETLGGVDRYACGFAWVKIYSYKGKKIDGRSKIAKDLRNSGVYQDYTKVFQIWNPSGFSCQNVDTLEAGASAAAEVFNKYGFAACAGSRLD